MSVPVRSATALVFAPAMTTGIAAFLAATYGLSLWERIAAVEATLGMTLWACWWYLREKESA